MTNNYLNEIIKFEDIVNFNALSLKREYDLNYEDFLDLKQEGYLHLVKYANSYKDKGFSFKHFCNVSLKRCMRRYVFRKILTRKNIDNELNLDISKEDNIDFDLIGEKIDVYRLIDTLSFDSEDDKFAFIFKLEGDTDVEIGKTLRMSNMQVKRSINTTIKRIQRILNLKECC